MSDTIKLSEARSKMTQLHKILKPGEILNITKRGKAYARLELVDDSDCYDKVLKSIESLPDLKGKPRSVAQSYKSYLYKRGDTKNEIP